MGTASNTLSRAAFRLEPLTVEAFAPFGFVIEIGNLPVPANGGTALRHDAGDLAPDVRPGTQLRLSLFDCEPQSFPLDIRELERHLHSAQTIAPMQAADYVVVVAPSNRQGMPDMARLRAFRASAGQAVNYHPGIWHHGIIALGGRSLFFVQSWQDGSAADCEILPVAPVSVSGPEHGDVR